MGREIEGLSHGIVDHGFLRNITFSPEDTEIVAVHDYQGTVGAGQDIVASAGASPCLIRFADSLTETEVGEELSKDVHTKFYFLIKQKPSLCPHRVRATIGRISCAAPGTRDSRGISYRCGRQHRVAQAWSFMITGYNPGQRHLEEADMEADRAGHQEVVVLSLDGTERAVLLLFVCDVFVETPGIALDVGGFAHNLDKR